MRFTNLQALRIIGAAIVLLCHLRHFAFDRMGLTSPALDWIFNYLSGPTLAVFFAMSGFVLVQSLQKSSARQFILNRLVRVYPAYWAAVGIAIFLKRVQGNRFFWDNRLIPGLMLIPVGVGRADYRLGVEWTLVFEIFFYAALGVMLLFSPRRGPMVGSALWLAAIIGAMCLRLPGEYDHLPNWTEIAFSPLAAPFLMGALASPLMRFASQLRLACPILVPALFAVSKLIGRWDVAVLVVGAGAALAVLWAASVKQLSSENPLVIYGDWSYGVYLLHVPVITAVIDASLFRQWTYPSFELVVVAGFAAMLVGLAFGRCEAAVYRRIRNWLRSRGGPAKPRLVIHVPEPAAKAA